MPPRTTMPSPLPSFQVPCPSLRIVFACLHPFPSLRFYPPLPSLSASLSSLPTSGPLNPYRRSGRWVALWAPQRGAGWSQGAPAAIAFLVYYEDRKSCLVAFEKSLDIVKVPLLGILYVPSVWRPSAKLTYIRIKRMVGLHYCHWQTKTRSCHSTRHSIRTLILQPVIPGWTCRRCWWRPILSSPENNSHVLNSLLPTANHSCSVRLYPL